MNSDIAAHVLPGYESAISVTSVSAGAASAAITIENVTAGAYITISIDDGAGEASGAYVTAKANAAPANPDPTATSGTGRTQWYSVQDLRALVFRSGDQIKVYVPGAGTYYVRQHRGSP